jgi:hypothetical protein
VFGEEEEKRGKERHESFSLSVMARADSYLIASLPSIKGFNYLA